MIKNKTNIITKGLAVKTMRNTKQKGFTLIELLVVIAIIGLLASVVLLSLNSARQKSRDAKRLADVRQIASALELYFNDCGGYPTTGAVTFDSTLMMGSSFAGTNACTANGIVASGSTVSNTYMGQFPTAPTPADTPCTGVWNSYTYTSAASASYTLRFCLGNTTGGYAAGSRTLSQNGIQ